MISGKISIECICPECKKTITVPISKKMAKALRKAYKGRN